jgi:hypothetical protein
MDYIYSYYNLKIASFEDISTISQFDSKQKTFLYRQFIDYLKNINNYQNGLSRLLSLFQEAKFPVSSDKVNSLDPGFFSFIKTNYKTLNNEPFGGLYNFGNILYLYVTLLKKNIIQEGNLNNPKVMNRVESVIRRNPSLNVSFDDFKRFVEANVIKKVKEIYVNHSKRLSKQYDAAFIKKCIDQYLKTESSLAYVEKSPSQQKQEEIDSLRQQSQEQRQKEKQQQIPIKQQEAPKRNWSPTKEKYKKYFEDNKEESEETDEEEDGTEAIDGKLEHKSSSIKIALELSQEDYSLFGATVLPEFFRIWLKTYAIKRLQEAGLAKKTQSGSSFKKEETTDATGNIIRIGDKVKLVPTFSGDDDDKTVYIITAITNSIDTIEQDPSKRLDFVSLRDLNGRTEYDQEPHYMLMKVDDQVEASEDDLLFHQALYDVLMKEAESSLMSTDIVQKTMDDLNPGDKAKAVDPNGNEIAVSVNPTGDVNLTEQNSTETPLTASKEAIPQLEEKGFRLVQEQV